MTAVLSELYLHTLTMAVVGAKAKDAFGGPGMGPPVTVFVGNITERAPDAMVRHLLTTCGPVISWKRVQGATV